MKTKNNQLEQPIPSTINHKSKSWIKLTDSSDSSDSSDYRVSYDSLLLILVLPLPLHLFYTLYLQFFDFWHNFARLFLNL